MAHEFLIKNKTNNELAYFWGYGNGFIYKAFKAKRYDLGISGINHGFTLSKKEAYKSLKKAIKAFYKLDYPDPARCDELILFLDRIKSTPIHTKFYIHFS